MSDWNSSYRSDYGSQWRYSQHYGYVHMPNNPGCNCVECDNTFMGHNYMKRCNCPGCEAQRMRKHREMQNTINNVEGGGITKVSTINFCDRCESMGKSEAMGVVQIQPSQMHNRESFEICPGCVQDFMDWRKDVMTTREKAYKEPWKEEEEPEDKGEVVLTKDQARKFLRMIEAGETNAD